LGCISELAGMCMCALEQPDNPLAGSGCERADIDASLRAIDHREVRVDDREPGGRGTGPQV